MVVSCMTATFALPTKIGSAMNQKRGILLKAMVLRAVFSHLLRQTPQFKPLRHGSDSVRTR